jgi:hypothetical protein
VAFFLVSAGSPAYREGSFRRAARQPSARIARRGRQALRANSYEGEPVLAEMNSASASAAPTPCANTKAGTLEGSIPENVAVKPRAKVTAGFAKEVDAVNQYAAAMYAPTAIGALEGA